MIQLGNKVRDTLTGFTGIAVARTEWLHGCSRFAIESPKLDKNGKPTDAQWFDEQRVELLEATKPVVSVVSQAKTGGPQADPVR